MIDMAKRDGLTIDAGVLERELGVPVIATVAVRRRGLEAIKAALGAGRRRRPPGPRRRRPEHEFTTVQRRARAIAAAATISESAGPPLDPPRSTRSCCTRASGR